MMIFVIIFIILGFYFFAQPNFSGSSHSYERRDVIGILRERYARGEIDQEEFRARERELRM
ncbi:MAG: SHOCT domain-containing protein [Desulfitobacteriaceae bacterium]